ncbi:MAG: hypothetical protein KJ066_15210 [Acidobacteria bacterium]|nr:hypothetical protein [Acidobacteriota bacterium]
MRSDLFTPIAVCGYAFVLLTLALASSAPDRAVFLWPPLAAATVLLVALRQIGVPRWAAVVAGLAWGIWPGRIAAGDEAAVRWFFLLPLALVALHRALAGRRVRHMVEFGGLAGAQAAAAGAAGAAVLAAALGGALGLAAAVGRWRSRSTLRTLAIAGITAAVVVGASVAAGLRASPFATGASTAAGWGPVAEALVSVPEDHLVYGWTRVLPAHGPAAFPGAVTLVLALAGWWRSRALDLAAVATAAVGVSGASLAAMAWLSPSAALPAAAVAFMLGIAVLAGIGAESMRRIPRRAARVPWPVVLVVALLWIEAVCVARGAIPDARQDDARAAETRVVYSAVSIAFSPGSGLPLERL